jgi:methionyl-tRNA formyltransferase
MRDRVLFLGLPLGALCLMRELEVVGACISRPEQPGMFRLRRRLAGPILERPNLEDEAVRAQLRELRPDLIVSWFWTKRIPVEVIALAPFAFNLHPSLLPRLRGPDPYFWAIARGDEETGVSAHVLTERYDEGPVISQRTLRIPEGVDAWKLARALDRPSLSLMMEVATRYARGEALVAKAQDEALATRADEPTADDCELQWSWPLQTILRRVHAAAPWPGAFTDFEGTTVVITKARAMGRVPGLAEGEGAIGPDGVVIAASDGAIVVLEARLEDDDTILCGLEVAGLFGGLPRL